MGGRVTPSLDVPWLATDQAAHYVGLGVNAFRAAVKRREIAAIDDDGPRRYLRADLDAYLARKRVPARAELTPAKSAPPASRREQVTAEILEFGAKQQAKGAVR